MKMTKKVTLRVHCTPACAALFGNNLELFETLIRSDGLDPDVGMEIMTDNDVVVRMDLAHAIIMRFLWSGNTETEEKLGKGFLNCLLSNHEQLDCNKFTLFVSCNKAQLALVQKHASSFFR